MILLSYILIYVSLIWTFASSNPIPQRRRNRVEEEFLKSYFGSGFNFRANRNRNRKIDDSKDAINTSKNYATVGIVINYLKFIVGTSLASRKTQDFTLQDLSRKTLVARLARQKFT